MSSLRNAIPRRTHKERAQPSHRKKYGLLEKHKDYVLRARDYHMKQDTLRLLREKASFKNPDEFYFKMENSVLRDGVHRSLENEKQKYTQEEFILMKTQDIGYLQSKTQSEIKKVERMKSSLQLTEKQPVNKIVKFEEGEDGEVKPVQVKKRRPLLQPLTKKLKKCQDSSYNELKLREIRAKSMSQVIDRMTIKKHLLQNGNVKKIRKENKVVYKWRKERQK